MSDESALRVPHYIALFAGAGAVMFCIDFVLGTTQFLHTGPFGLTWAWSPGMTVPYLAAVFYLLMFLRGDSLDGLAR